MFGRTGRASVCVTKGGVLVHSYEPDCFETCTLHVWHALFLILEALPDCAAWFDAGSLKKLDRFPSVFSDQLDGPSMYIYLYIPTRWWFQIFFMFTATVKSDPIWLIFFRWVGSTTNQYIYIFPPFDRYGLRPGMTSEVTFNAAITACDVGHVIRGWWSERWVTVGEAPQKPFWMSRTSGGIVPGCL